MPSTLTHYTFLKLIDPNLNKIANIGAQGPDPFFFYFASLKKDKNSKKIEDIGHFLHNIDPTLTFLFFIKYIKNSKKDRDLIYDYLKGLVAHYALDSITHPYIFYKSGFVTKDDNNTKKYFLSHAAIESSIDRLVADHFNIKKSPSFMLKSNKKDLLVISNIYYEYLNNYYHFNYIEKNTFYIATKRMQFVYKIIYSRFPFKKKLFRKFAHNSSINVFSTPTTKQVLNYDFLNLKHNEYKDCTDNLVSYHYDFYQLIEIAQNYYIKIINCIDKILKNNEKDSSLFNVINSINHNGFKINKEMKYYDLIFKSMYYNR